MENNPPKKSKAVLIFILSFVAIFVILNFQTVYGRVSALFESNQREGDLQAYYIQLENFYKDKYKDLNYLLPTMPAATGQASQSSGNIELPAQAQASGGIQPATLSNYLSIPKLKIRAPILTAPNDENQILKTLKKGVVLFPGSASPGQPGTSVIIGHSSSNFPFTKYSDVFAGLNNLVRGDLIYLSYGGKDYVYTVKDKKLGSPEELASLNFDSDLVLGSCWPVGTASNRVIILADLE